MNIKKLFVLLAATMIVIGALTGCSSTPGGDESLATVSVDESSSESEELLETSIPLEANFYVGADFNNLLNGGYITEDADYVYFCGGTNYSMTVYRYEKESGIVMNLSEHGEKYLNVSEDGFLFAVERTRNGTDQIWKINTETGADELFCNPPVLLNQQFGFTLSESSDIEVKSMVIADKKLVMIMECDTIDQAFVFAIDTQTSEVQYIERYQGDEEYGSDLYLDIAFMAADKDELYFASQKGEDKLYLKAYNVFTGELRIEQMMLESGKELNDARSYSSTGFGNGYTYDIPSYDVEFFEAVSNNALYSFTRTWMYHKYSVYDMATGVLYEPEDPLGAVREQYGDWSIYDTAFHEDRFYFLTTNHEVVYLLEDFSEGGVFYSLDGLLNSDGEQLDCYNCQFGFANDALWLLDSVNARMITLDGNCSTMDVSDAEEVVDPFDTNIYGTVNSETHLYETPSAAANRTICSITSGTEVIVLAKVIDYVDCVYYKVQLEDGTVGYIWGKRLNVSEDPDTVLYTDSYGKFIE